MDAWFCICCWEYRSTCQPSVAWCLLDLPGSKPQRDFSFCRLQAVAPVYEVLLLAQTKVASGGGGDTLRGATCNTAHCTQHSTAQHTHKTQTQYTNTARSAPNGAWGGCGRVSGTHERADSRNGGGTRPHHCQHRACGEIVKQVWEEFPLAVLCVMLRHQ